MIETQKADLNLLKTISLPNFTCSFAVNTKVTLNYLKEFSFSFSLHVLWRQIQQCCIFESSYPSCDTINHTIDFRLTKFVLLPAVFPHPVIQQSAMLEKSSVLLEGRVASWMDPPTRNDDCSFTRAISLGNPGELLPNCGCFKFSQYVNATLCSHDSHSIMTLNDDFRKTL